MNDCKPILPPEVAAPASARAVATARRMVWLPGGEFTMGSDEHNPEERPERRAHREAFWIDETAVTSTSHVGFRCIVRAPAGER